MKLAAQCCLGLLVLLAAAGCFGSDDSTDDRGASIPVARLSKVVLQPEDLAPAFQRFDEGAQLGSEQPLGVRGDSARFGRQGGWKARYRRPGSSRTRGPLVVESRVDVFGDSRGAAQELDAHRSELIEGFRPLDRDPRLGDDGFAATGTEGSGQFKVRSYLVAWKTQNATASVLVNGFDGKLTLDQVVELAGMQQRRLARAT